MAPIIEVGLEDRVCDKITEVHFQLDLLLAFLIINNICRLGGKLLVIERESRGGEDW